MFGPRNGQWGGDVHTQRLSIRGKQAAVALALLAVTIVALWAACTPTEAPPTAGQPAESLTAAAEPARIDTVVLVPTAPPVATPPPTATPVPTPEPTATSVPTPPPTATPEPPPSPLSAFANGRWLEGEAPELASAINGLVWVRDGLDDGETQALEELLYIAVDSLDLASSIVALEWLQDGVDEVEAQAIEWVSNFADADVAEAVVALGWMQDSIDVAEVSTVQRLSYIAQDQPNVAIATVLLGWVQDGINSTEAQALLWIDNMANAEVAASVVSLDWMLESVEEREVEAIGWIAAIKEADVAAAAVSLAWVQDGIQESEASALKEMSNFANDFPDVVLMLLGLAWMQDDVVESEIKAVEKLSEFEDTASTIMSLLWVQNGIDEKEMEVLDDLQTMWVRSEPAVAAILSLLWAQDDLEWEEQKAIRWLTNYYRQGFIVAESLMLRSWIQDGINRPETVALQYMSYLTNLDLGTSQQIAEMPFLTTLEPPDVEAIQSLWRLARIEPELFKSVIAHPALQTGITDDFAPVVATLYGVARYNRELFPVLLDPANTHLEQRTITLPLAGEVVMVIIRSQSGAQRSIDLLEHAVRSAESLMQAPLPTNYVGLLYEDAVSSNAAGTNFGTHIAVRPKYDVDDNSHESNFAGSIIAHEVAHYYWRGNADWVDEGASDFMTSISEERRVGSPVGTTNYPCPFTRTIYDLEALDPALGDDEFTCNYALGERLFVDLYQTIGEEAFQAGFLDLYLASQEEDEADGLEGTSVNIEHVRQAFGAGDALVDDVIGRWYDGSVPYDLSRLDTSPVDPSLPSFKGRVNQATVAIGVKDQPATEFSAATATGKVLLALKVTYQVYSIMESLDVEIAEYYEDGFQFSRRTRPIGAEALYIGATYYFWVGPPAGKWATGRYYVYLYADGHKIAQVEYTVVP